MHFTTKFCILIFLMLTSTAHADYWNDPYHLQMGFSTGASYFFFKDNQSITNHSTFILPGFQLKLGSSENYYTLGFGWGGYLNFDNNRPQEYTFDFSESSIEIFMNTNKNGHFIELAEIKYVINPTYSNINLDRKLMKIAYGYCFDLNLNFKISIDAGILRSDILRSQNEYIVRLQFVGMFTDTKSMTPKNWFNFGIGSIGLAY